jgi:flagellar hook protein FlgE
MSILGAMYAAVSGLNANSNALGIISDNIANANTVGYKDTSTDFLTLVTQSGITSEYSPGGVQTKPIYNIAQQGAIQGSSSPTDLAIAGGGLFVVNSTPAGATGNGTTSFTRAGNFTIDANGNVVNAAGLYLHGQTLTPAQSAAIAAGGAPTLAGSTVGALTTVNVNSISDTATPTANVTLAANLPADSASPQTMTVPVYDTQGVEHDMTLTFTPTATPNQWSVGGSFASAGTTTATVAAGDNIVQFNPDGTIDAAASTFNTAGALSIAWDPAVSGGTSPQALSFNIGANGTTNGLSQLGSTFNVTKVTQDGVQFGNFSSVSVGTNGVVTARFTNGLTTAIAIVPLATFENPNGLTPESGDTYLESAESGTPLLQLAGTGAAGQIEASSLENSTVDIATEFSKLIIAQQSYSANSKVLTTANQMTQSLLQIQTG